MDYHPLTTRKGWSLPPGVPASLRSITRRGVRFSMTYDYPISSFVTPGQLIRTPRVLFLTSAVMYGPSPVMGYYVGGNEGGDLNTTTIAYGYTWAKVFDQAMYAEHKRVQDLFATLPDQIRSLWQPGDPPLIIYHQVDSVVQMVITNDDIALTSYDHLVVPPFPDSPPLVGVDFLNIYVGGPSIYTCQDYLNNPRVVDDVDTILPKNLAFLTRSFDYMLGYATRVFSNPADGLDDLDFDWPEIPDVTAQDWHNQDRIDRMVEAARRNRESYKASFDRWKDRYRRACQLMQGSTEAAKAYGVDAEFMGDSAEVTGELVVDLVARHWKLGEYRE